MGSTFAIELPAESHPGHLIGAQEAGNTVPDANVCLWARHKVLYFEDNLSNLTLMKHLFADRVDVEPMTANMGQTGLDMTRQHAPYLGLPGYHLPNMDGHEVLYKLMTADQTRSIPGAIVSADATSAQMDRLKAAGADHYLTKPLDVHHFLDVLEKVLR